MNNNLEIPTVDAYLLNNIQSSFFCKYCNKPHIHGLVPGHRSAHCPFDEDKSPYLKTGYILNIKLEDNFKVIDNRTIECLICKTKRKFTRDINRTNIKNIKDNSSLICFKCRATFLTKEECIELYNISRRS